MNDWAVRCKSQADFDRIVLILDALDIEVFGSARKGGFDWNNPYVLMCGVGGLAEAIRAPVDYVKSLDLKALEIEEAYEYILRWKEHANK